MKNLVYFLFLACILAACARKDDDPAPAVNNGCISPPSGMPKSILYVDNLNGNAITYDFCYDNLGRISKAISTNGYNNVTTLLTYGFNGKLESLVNSYGTGANTQFDSPIKYRWIGNNLRSIIKADSVFTPSRRYVSALKYIFNYTANGSLDNYLYMADTMSFAYGVQYYYDQGSTNPIYSDYVTSLDSGYSTTAFPWSSTTIYSYDSLNRLKLRNRSGIIGGSSQLVLSYDNFSYNAFPTELIRLILSPFYDKSISIEFYTYHKYATFLGLEPSISVFKDYDRPNGCDFSTYRYKDKTKNASGNLTGYRYIFSYFSCGTYDVVKEDYNVTITY